jgi:uncharacterized Fe-S radical SAM superfamily protein PflX
MEAMRCIKLLYIPIGEYFTLPASRKWTRTVLHIMTNTALNASGTQFFSVLSTLICQNRIISTDLFIYMIEE